MEREHDPFDPELLEALTGDWLRTMFAAQRDFQARIGSPIFSNGPIDLTVPGEERMEFIKEMALAAIVELSEFIQRFPWKSWSQATEADIEGAIEELVDVQHFVNNLALALNLTAGDYFEAFMKKMAENHRRQDEGY